MSCQKVTSVRQTALLLSTKLQYEAVIQVQARARIPEIRSISDLHTEHIVPKIGNYGHVFDVTSQQFTFTHFPFTNIELTVHFTVLHSPQGAKNPNPVKNVALQKFVGSHTISWFGNMLIIAHVPCGMPIPFTCDLIDSARVLLANLLRLRTTKDVLKYAQWRVYRPLGEVPITPERNSFANTVFPNEMLLEIFEKCDTHSLAALSASSSGMRTMVRASLFMYVRSALVPFLPENKIAEFFDCLTDVKGVVFGDVPLRVQLREKWPLTTLYIAMPRGQSIGFVGWPAACGYARRPISRSRAWGSLHVYGLQNERISTQWIYLYESENEFAVTPVLAAKSTARMTMLTGHTLISPYTKLTEDLLCITSTPLDILHFQSLGLKVALDAKDLGVPCGAYCPRKKRTLESRHNVDIVPWGGMRQDESIPEIELDVLKSNLAWTLGNTCRNVLCGKCGVDRNILFF